MNRLAGKTAIVTGRGRYRPRLRASHGGGGCQGCHLRRAGEGRPGARRGACTRRIAMSAFWKVDVTEEAAVKSAIDAAAARFGGLDVMVNNAGISGSPKPTEQVTEAEWDRVQAVNVKGVFFGTKHAIPHLRAAGGGVDHQPVLHRGADRRGRHCALSRLQGRGAADEQERCDHLCAGEDPREFDPPGYIWTPMVENHLRATSDDLEAAKAAAGAVHPIGHMGEPDDIAWAVVWLASEEAKFVTGAEIVIDGGYTAR